MSGVKIVRALLVADAAVLALVPATRIIAGTLPQGTNLPALAITEVSVIDANIISAAAKTYCVSRVQVTIIASAYPAQKALLAAVRTACRSKIGTIAGFTPATVHTDSTGPDFNDPDTGFYMQSQDFKVGFFEVV